MRMLQGEGWRKMITARNSRREMNSTAEVVPRKHGWATLRPTLTIAHLWFSLLGDHIFSHLTVITSFVSLWSTHLLCPVPGAHPLTFITHMSFPVFGELSGKSGRGRKLQVIQHVIKPHTDSTSLNLHISS